MQFDKVIFDSRDFDPVDDRIITTLKVRLILGDQILSLLIRAPRDYPEQPVELALGPAFKNISPQSANEALYQANLLARERANEKLPQLHFCLSVLKDFMTNYSKGGLNQA